MYRKKRKSSPTEEKPKKMKKLPDLSAEMDVNDTEELALMLLRGKT